MPRNNFALAALLFILPATGQDVKNTSYKAPNGERVQRLEIEVDATLEQVWNIVGSSEGWKSFMAPAVEMDLKTGGKFHSNYKLGSKVGDPGTIYNTVLAYVPLRMLSLKIGLTPMFPQEVREAGTVFAVMNMDEAGPGKVRISEVMAGWQEGPGWDKAYMFFEEGNAYTLRELAKRIKDGPVDWDQKARAVKHP